MLAFTAKAAACTYSSGHVPGDLGVLGVLGVLGTLGISGVSQPMAPPSRRAPVPNAIAVFQLCTTLAVFGISVSTVLEDPAFANIERNLDVVELWSGVGTVVAAGAARGLQGLPFDKDREPGVTEH